jgi:hypothetical protein
MTPSFHIYRKFDGCKLSWQESAFTLDDAKAQVQRLGLSRPGEYLIFNHKTVDSVSIIVTPPKLE